MQEVILSLLGGALIGFIFKIVHLPLPAPQVLAGVMGVLGVYLGGKLFDFAGKLF